MKALSLVIAAAFASTTVLLDPTILTQAAEPTAALPLAGSWRFALDREDRGGDERWWTRRFEGAVWLPGTLPAQGIGDEVTPATAWTGGIVDRSWFTAPEWAPYRAPGNVKVPFWLQPERHYVGAAWYQREIEIPELWAGQRVVLSLERPHWETRVWVDDRLVGTNRSLGTPHDYDLGRLSSGPHTLTIRVDNRLVVDVGHDSHSVSDHTQGNWNGIVGRIELRATPPVWVDDLQVYPRVATQSIEVKGRLGNVTGQPGRGTLVLRVEEEAGQGGGAVAGRSLGVSWEVEGGVFATELSLGASVRLWDEFDPVRYRLSASLDAGGAVRRGVARAVTFGLREFTARGTQFLLNGRKTYVRGTLDCCIYPKTGHPPTEVAEWKRVIGVARAHGLNNLRFHSWCPPEAAFLAADELGFFLHVECSSWANSSTTLGDGKPVDAWLYEETERVLRYYGNHPSFVLMAYGNEPGGPRHREFLARWVEDCKAKDPRRLYTSGAGWPQLPENQWHSAPDPRVQAWGGGLGSRINARPPETVTDYRAYIEQRAVPVISHEIGQWCVYPSFDEMEKYTGYLKPRNFEIFRELLAKQGMLDQARAFLLASGKLQTLCYKEDIESALRTAGMGGFQLLDLHDFPGQGTALIGVLDPFWEPKGYVTAAEFSRFCDATVPLARLAQRVFTTDETLEAQLEVAHFGPEPLRQVALAWRLEADHGAVVARGDLPRQTIPVDNGIALGSVRAGLGSLAAPARYRLVAALETEGGRARENDWDIWVYPAQVETAVPPGVQVVHGLTDETVAALEQGARALLLIPPSRVRPDPKLGKVALGFSSIFWNTAWTRRQPPHTLGILCDPGHPLFAQFPTEFHSNWQWWYLVSRAGAMILDDLPQALRPTVQVVDDWFTARRLGLVFEAKVGRGKLLVCSIDLENDLGTNVVVRQFRRSLLDYVASDRFEPAVALEPAQVRSLMAPPSPIEKLGVRVRASSAHPGHEAALAVDGNPATLWHTAWEDPKPTFPHELVLEFGQPARLAGIALLPRQDGNRNGWIKEYAVYQSADGQSWGSPIAQGTCPNDGRLHPVTFVSPTQAKYLRLVALSGYANGPWASLAELEPLIATP
ncbi:MAG: glycoside hydrolase [Verrucomicrobia bacterium]|nr:glycoside hydrolase [Verrucomicrobiota bacterium]